MHYIPFHRRILPWLYIVIFFVTAPVLIFYTAGYRYNTKKRQIERNGTLIVDSFPTGAAVSIDDKDTGETTPITFQNISPGIHHISLSKPAYQTWGKNLEVRSELVTFANNIWLWRAAGPALVLPGKILKSSADPALDKLALIYDASSTPSLLYWTPETGATRSVPLNKLSPSSTIALRWQAAGDAVLINGIDLQDPAWWSQPETGGAFADLLPNGLYYWRGDELLGSDDTSNARLLPRNKSFTRNPFAPGTVSSHDGLTLQMDTSTNRLTLIEDSFITRVFSLPAGQWRFGGFEKPYALLKEDNRWLALNPKSSQPYGGQVYGDYPRWLSEKEPLQSLFINQNEVWQWKLGENSALIWRQSEPIIQAAWHRSGTAIFIASASSVFAVELDERNGRIVTPLAEFEQIFDIATLGKSLYIAGMKDGKRGLWALPVE